MKRSYIHIVICLTTLFFAGCKKLERDNPLDANKGTTGTTGTTGTPIIKFSRYKIVYDGNGNGIINTNENVELLIYVKNTGTAIANQVKATITCPTTYISYSIYGFDQLSFSDIDTGSEKSGSNYSTSSWSIDFYTKSPPSGTNVTFDLTITDNASHTWSDSFTITIY